MTLPPPVIRELTNTCAPSVAPRTMGALVAVESGGDPLAIGINGPRPARLHPHDLAEATRLSDDLIRRGANIDLGLGQINNHNLRRLRLSIAAAFDPCSNLAAAARILADDYVRSEPVPGREQAALTTSLSLYNTGNRERGFHNGYVARVTSAAAHIVPQLEPGAQPAASTVQSAPLAAWDVFASSPPMTAGFVLQPQTTGDRP